MSLLFKRISSMLIGPLIKFKPLLNVDADALTSNLLTMCSDFMAADIYNNLIIVPVLDEADLKGCEQSFYQYPLPHLCRHREITVNNWSFAYHPDYLMWATTHYVRTQLGFLWNTYGKPIVVSEFGQLSIPH